MIGFRNRLLLLTGGATAIAIGAVLMSAGFVDVEVVEWIGSGIVTGVALLILSLLVAVWYESQERRTEP